MDTKAFPLNSNCELESFKRKIRGTERVNVGLFISKISIGRLGEQSSLMFTKITIEQKVNCNFEECVNTCCFGRYISDEI